VDHIEMGVLKGQLPGCGRGQVARDDTADAVDESTRSEDEPPFGAEPGGVGVGAAGQDLEPRYFSARLLPGAPPE
jgi:hypothetical protein